MEAEGEEEAGYDLEVAQCKEGWGAGGTIEKREPRNRMGSLFQCASD